ncbi:MAG: hypothetical protein ACLP2Q_18520 [Steroidobacteraceae bacterium]
MVIEFRTSDNALAADDRELIVDAFTGVRIVLVERCARRGESVRIDRRRRGGRAIEIPVRERRRSAAGVQAAERQVVIGFELQIARPHEPCVKRVALIGFGVEIASKPVCFALIQIAPVIEVAQQLIRNAGALLITVGFLDIIDAASVLMVNRRQQSAECIGPREQAIAVAREASARREAEVVYRRIAQIFVSTAHRDLGERLAALGVAAARHEVDRSTERLGVDVRAIRLGQLDAAD